MSPDGDALDLARPVSARNLQASCFLPSVAPTVACLHKTRIWRFYRCPFCNLRDDRRRRPDALRLSVIDRPQGRICAMALNALHHVTVKTGDLEVTRDFYRNILGL